MFVETTMPLVPGNDPDRCCTTEKPRSIADMSEPSALVEAAVNEISDELSAGGLKVLQVRKVGVVLLSEFLARIWLCTKLLPSPVTVEGITDVSIYPFITTATSNINHGTLADGTLVAMKTVRRSQARPASEEDIKRLFLEATISLTTSHRNIMPSLGMHVGCAGSVYLVSTLQKRGTLPDYLALNPEVDRLLLMNVLVDDEGEPLLIDMGFSMVLDSVTSTFSPASHLFTGNARWTPCEKICPTEFPLTLKADSFSFASFMLEVLSGNVPYRHINSDSAVIVEVLLRRRLPRRPDDAQLTDALWDLMTKCWSLDPGLRPSMDDIHHTLQFVRTENGVGVY
ncbi:hypothetical protein C0991_001553 [Blastosporella zonata]|nr:hypothetical protein C0991_001553 [Blastosporella zonata]